MTIVSIQEKSAMITVVITSKSNWKRPARPTPGSFSLIGPSGASGGHGNAWRTLRFHRWSSRWTIRLFPSLSSATQTYLVTFNLCPPVPFCFQIAALHELVPPVIALLGMTPPPGSLPPLAAADPRIPGTIMCIRHFTRWNFFPSFFFLCHVLFVRSWDSWEQGVYFIYLYAARVFITQKELKELIGWWIAQSCSLNMVQIIG